MIVGVVFAEGTGVTIVEDARQDLSGSGGCLHVPSCVMNKRCHPKSLGFRRCILILDEIHGSKLSFIYGLLSSLRELFKTCYGL
ncbi:hypothetical protein HanXRQr2_Chr08g0335651 [Helianthus annuus]|uniref:Uncharacterized protein n=1 Tax=Helianthus annuus TaxID=4232 RepID=A0A9K3IE96_HELAN|nr:hypothetical protein HanXRQr2_Chr08g0335651 [Helianthus annuus]KAJ0901349.1 hypothetical protein HanPSC8_Chr08g0324291 [Helianthus annuus]